MRETKNEMYRNKKTMIEIECALEGTAKMPKLTISGSIREIGVRGGECSGQCEDTILESLKTNTNLAQVSRLKKIIKIWKRWHLNDMNAGTPKQEKFLRDYQKKNPGWKWEYEECRKLLVKHLGSEKGYGEAWYYELLPIPVIKELIKIFGFSKKWLREQVTAEI